MRNYSMVYPGFWIGGTGRAIADLGADELAIAFYLMTCPSANHIGFYHMPPILGGQELRWPEKRFMKGLARVCETGFAKYAEAFQHVWVVEMAKYQIGERLKLTDLRIKGVHRTLERFQGSPLLPGFLARYREDFHLGSFVSPSEAPFEAKRTREQENKGTREQGNKGAPAEGLGDLAIPPELVSPESLQAVQEWIDYKRARGEAYKSPRYLEKKLAEFADPEQLVAAINNSMGNNWAGLFPARGGARRAADPRGNAATVGRFLEGLR